MRKPTSPRRAGAIIGALSAALALTLSASAQAQPKRVALLVGVGSFSKPGIRALEGPASDVAALRDVLLRRWGYAAQDVTTLVDAQASRTAILAALSALGQRSASGDEVLIYFSGHGTSALDANVGLPVPHGSGAFTPADFDPSSPDPLKTLIVGRTDLVPILSALEAGGRKLWVISDSCYSGQQVRSIQIGAGDTLPTRMLPMKVGPDARDQAADLALAAKAPPPPPYPYHGTAYLSAAAEGERALDIPRHLLAKMPTIDGKPHGAMTDALLRVLEGKIAADLNGDGLLSLDEVHRATADFMAQRAYGQSPQRLPAVLEDQDGLGSRPVLGARDVAAKASHGAPQALRVRLLGAPAALSRAVAGLPGVQAVGEAAATDITVRVSPERIHVIAASGDLLASLPVDANAQALAQVRQLAWAQHLRGLAEMHQRGALAAEITPAAFGGNFVIGSKVAYVVKPERAATLVMLNISSDGKVSVLYPFYPSESAPLPAGKASQIPGAADMIKVQEPVGMDLQLIFAFDAPPAGLERLHRLENADPDDPRLLAFERTVSAMHGKFSFAATNLRTLKPAP